MLGARCPTFREGAPVAMVWLLCGKGGTLPALHKREN